MAQRTRKWILGELAKHEHEELKEGTWLKRALTLLRKKVWEEWTEKHRNVAEKLFLEGGWAQKRLFDIGWSVVSQCQALSQGGRQRKEQASPLPRMARNPTGDSRGLLKVGAKSKNLKEGVEVAKRYR